MTHPQQTTREVLEQCVQALKSVRAGIYNDATDRLEFWYIHPAIQREADAALAAGRAALAHHTPSSTGEADLEQALRERDRYHDVADDLAAQIAAITDADIGEHSSANDPWHNAMLAADEFIANQLRILLSAPPQVEPAPAISIPETVAKWANSPELTSGLWGDGYEAARAWVHVQMTQCQPSGEPAPTGCAHCQNPLYAGTKCKNCGRVTEPAPSTAGERAELLKALSENRLNYSDQSKLAALLQSTALPVDVQERETNSVASQKHTALIDKLFMALKTARDHIDMEALALSHYKDATTIRSTIEAAKQAAHGITKKGG